MKKLACILLVLCLSAGLFGCSSENGNNASSGGAESTASTSSAPAQLQEASRNVNKTVEVVKVTGDGVNVRAQASTDGEVYGQADNGDYFLLKSAETDWNKIVYEGKEAYVSSQYSKVEQVPEATVSSLLKSHVAGTDDEMSSSEASSPSSEVSATPAPESKNESSGTTVSDIRSSEDAQAR